MPTNSINERLTIVVVSHDCREELRECLGKLNEGDRAVSIIVVDNASTDYTVELLAKLFPSARLIKNSANRGFAVAANQGIRASASDFVLLLAPDTLLDQSDLQKLYEALSSGPDVGICAPRLGNPDLASHPMELAAPSLAAMICEEFGLTRLFRRSRRYARLAGWISVGTREVEQFNQCCLLVRRTALEHVGLLDERFFLYFEGVDLCWRLRQANWRTLVVSEAVAAPMAGHRDKSERQEVLGHWYQDLFTFYRLHYPRWQLVFLRFVVQITSLFRSMAGRREYWPTAKNVWKL